MGDNTIMIHAGDWIDNSIGFTFGLATLVAAGFGQVLSDSSGVVFGNSLEAFCGRKINLTPPDVTPHQRNTLRFRMVTTGGALLGVIFGCILGLLNLLIIDLERKERREKQRELDGIFELVMSKGPEVFECEACSLFIYDPDEKVLWTKVSSTGYTVTVPMTKTGVCTSVFKSGETMVIEEEEDSLVSRDSEKESGFVTRNMLAAPVFMDDKCIAVIEVMNKCDDRMFTEEDLSMLKVLCGHVGLFCSTFSYEEMSRDEEKNDAGRLVQLKSWLKK